MPERFEDTDLSEARFEGVNLSRARFRNVNLDGVKMVDAYLANADLSGLIDGLKINGIEVGPLVAREYERRYPERQELFAADPEGFERSIEIVDGLWRETIARGRTLPEEARKRRVDEEWSLTETLRHMLFVIDGWITRMVLGRNDYHPYALPPSFITDVGGLGMDVDADPSFEEVVSAFEGRMDVVRDVVGRLTSDELDRDVVASGAGYPPEGTTNKVIGCLWTVMDEAWAHNRFANRDLDVIEANVP